ncbi:hypothetical protein BsWGS_27240 [Bradybaena similaris]
MTTTHTFQGLNADNKPSSRVLNPPGGSSSNIFGFDDQPKKQDSAKIHPEGATKGNDAASHAIPAATAGPQQKSGVPKSAFNPITGEPYEQSKPKQETPAPAAVVSESKLAVESNSVVESSAAVNIAESDKTQPATTPAATSASVPQQQKKQHQNGPFGVGSNEDPKEHRSTRVTQPPGGRSTKLW